MTGAAYALGVHFGTAEKIVQRSNSIPHPVSCKAAAKKNHRPSGLRVLPAGEGMTGTGPQVLKPLALPEGIVGEYYIALPGKVLIRVLIISVGFAILGVPQRHHNP